MENSFSGYAPGDILLAEKSRFSKAIQADLVRFAKISHDLRKDRELAFYGSEDLTPSEFYKKADADEAFKAVQWVVGKILIEMKN